MFPAEKPLAMTEIANLAVPYFGLIAIGFAWGKANGPPEPGLALTKVFLLYVSLPAPLFVNTSKTSELDNRSSCSTTPGTMTALVLALLVGRCLGGPSLRKAT